MEVQSPVDIAVVGEAPVRAAAAAPAAWGKPAASPWRTPAAVARSPPKFSLRDIQREEQENQDAQLALRLQLAETADNTATPVNTDPVTTTDGDATVEVTVVKKTVPEASELAFVDDSALAAALQAEFDQEHDEDVRRMERKFNGNGHSKVEVSWNLYRTSYANEHPAAVSASNYEDEEEDYNSDEEPVTVYDKSHKVMRDTDGQIVTKHNSGVCGRRNRRRMDEFPLSFDTGDTRRDDFKINNKVFNHLRRFSQKNERYQQRLHENKERSTNVLALDAKTRLILYRLVNAGVMEEVNGCISTGKESVIFGGRYRTNPDDPDSVRECAVKVFKTSLTEFKERQQFLHGDRRFDKRVGKQHARKLVKLWAEKEMANLTRMHSRGLNCPEVIHLRKHVLVMSLIGGDKAARKLKNVILSSHALSKCYDDVKEAMHKMYNDCKLVHADLSEYNILYHDGLPWIIDVGQSVEPTHPRALEFLYRDCHNVTRFFNQQGAAKILSAGDLYTYICGEAITSEEQSEYLNKLHAAKAGLKQSAQSDEEDSSSVCIHMPRVSSENKEILLQGSQDISSDEEEDDDDEDGELF